MADKIHVYLAGPICGCNKGEANDWRQYVAGILAPHNIVGISPLRCEPLVGERYALTHNDPRFGSARAIGSKNRFDVRSCPITLAFLPVPAPGRVQSYGTIIELAWANAYGSQTVLVSDDAYVRAHPVVDACVGWPLDSLEEACETIIGVLAGYVGGKNV